VTPPDSGFHGGDSRRWRGGPRPGPRVPISVAPPPGPRVPVSVAPPPPGTPHPVRSEIRRQLRQVARLRAATFVLIIGAVVTAPVGFFVIRDAARDPIFAELDSWKVPSWATTSHQDAAYGSRWCVRECRFRERTWQSSRATDQTNKVYVAVLHAEGWTSWRVAGCPATGVEGVDTCWQRDEYVLDLWVRDAPCQVDPVRPTVAASPTPAPATSSPSVSTSAAGGVPTPGCGKSLATVKVFNRIAYQQGG